MTKQEALQLFEERKVRTVWDDTTEEWYFSLVDVVEVLTDSVNPTDYLKKLRKRDVELNTYIGTNCPHVYMTTDTGKKRKTLSGSMANILRLIQSIPSPKAEPFKQWMAQVAAQRIDQMQNPELSIEQAMTDYPGKTIVMKRLYTILMACALMVSCINTQDNSEIDELKAYTEELQEYIEYLEQEIDELRNDTEEQQRYLEQEIEGLETDLWLIQSDIDDLDYRVSDLEW